jgi:subtilisin family serine protease
MSATARPSNPKKKRVAAALATTSLVGLAAWAAVSSQGSPDLRPNARIAAPGSASADGARAPALQRSGPQTYIVLFRDAPLAAFRGGLGIASPRDARSNRLNAKSRAAQEYVRYLQNRQHNLEAQLGRAVGRPLEVTMRMQHAVNGITTLMSEAEAARVAKQPGVLLVEASRDYELDTDAGPALIGAKTLWKGVTSLSGSGSVSGKGEGVVVGIIDTGINYASPSFSAVDPYDGYVHANPNGSGTYLGTCAPGGVDAGRCNDKLIGGNDFVCGPPGNSCGATNRAEEPGFHDNNGHGSHTASTAGGNERDVLFRAVPVHISGVAPRANVIAYDVCYTEISTGRGLCPGASSVAAANQAVADGVDVINFSIGGGTNPWGDAVSLAFLNAVDAGIYVATSAGNSGPGPATAGHNEPWVSSTAAAQHGRQGFDFLLQVSGPAPVPPALAGVPLTLGVNGVAFTSSIPATTPIALTPGAAAGAGIDGTSDGCSAYPAGTFAGAIAVIRRGTCSFSIKTNNAAAAGAIAVVITNNAAGGISPSVPGTTIPAFGISQADGNAIRDYYVANSGATGGIPYPPVVTYNVVDALAAFSSRGPAAFDVLKPDITAPGVNILATVNGPADALGLLSGTSMASPHQAGAAALLRQVHPAWTVPEMKSALTMTAARDVLLEDQVTPADALAAGAGRVRVDKAARSGLVLHETRARYLAANPSGGGDPSALNQPSMARAHCPTSCSFVRTVRSTLPYRQTWDLKVEGMTAAVSPKSITLNPGESRTIEVTVDGSGFAADGAWHFGTLLLNPKGTGAQNQSMLHMPVAVSVQPPPLATPLANGVPATGLSAAAGTSALYAIEVPAGASTLSIVTSGGTGDLDMLVKRGQVPNAVVYDCSSGGADNNESCNFNAPAAGTWYIRLQAFSAYSGATLVATWQ